MSAPLPVRLVLLDVDGTLVDSADAIVAAGAEAFAAARLAPIPRERMLAVVGLSLPRAFAALVGAGGPVDLMVEAYKAAYNRRQADPALAEPLFPGVDALLRALAARPGLALGLATGNSRRGVARLTARHGWAGLFATVQTADDAPSKPDPAMVRQACAEAGVAPGEALVLGDSPYDAAMARGAGARAVGVSWGHHAPAALLAAGAERVIDAPEALLGLLNEAGAPSLNASSPS